MESNYPNLISKPRHITKQLLEIASLEMVDCYIPIKDKRLKGEILAEGGFEILGCYRHLPSIEISREKCNRFNLSIGEKLKPQKMKEHTCELIVLVHELAHFVTHLGKGGKSKQLHWERFPKDCRWKTGEPEEDKYMAEPTAQRLTVPLYGVITSDDNDRLAGVRS